MNAYELARLADVASPDSLTSPGAQWLELIERTMSDYDFSGPYPEDTVHEMADSLVPVYTHERWQVFVDLAAYQEDPSELGATCDDMTQAAGIALYLIAERLISALRESEDDSR